MTTKPGTVSRMQTVRDMRRKALGSILSAAKGKEGKVSFRFGCDGTRLPELFKDKLYVPVGKLKQREPESWTCWPMPGIPALGVGKRQEGQEFKVSLGYNTKFEASVDYTETQSKTGTARKRHILKASSCVGVFTVTPSKHHSR